MNEQNTQPTFETPVNTQPTMNQPMQSAPTMSNNRPIKKFKSGAIIATIWANAFTNGNGEQSTIHTVSVNRVYKKENQSEWSYTTTFNIADLPKVQLVLTEAYRYLALVDVPMDYKE